MKCKYARATFSFTEFFTESVQEMIDDGELSTEQEIKDYLEECIMEDIEEWIRHSPNKAETDKHFSFDIEIKQ